MSNIIDKNTVEDVREQMFIRRALEGEIASEAALRLSEEGRAELGLNLAEAEAAAAGGDRAGAVAVGKEHRNLIVEIRRHRPHAVG